MSGDGVLLDAAQICRESITGCPVRSYSLYWLRYPKYSHKLLR